MLQMKKSKMHSKITGEFGEHFILYWLSKRGFECVRVDHTGIDLIAKDPKDGRLLGISVKSRSRYSGTEGGNVNIPLGDLKKASDACDTFGCTPFFAIVVDAPKKVE
jgi:Holliday junction resolvase-like predicted endonuclease